MIFHLEANHLLDDNHGGFRKNNSTMNTAVKFTNDIFNAMNKRHITVATFIDMAKAFDTVNHQILLNKIEKLGFRGIIYDLLKNYLFQRKQVTMANGTTSNQCNISCGIPQGSTVRPLMFIIYMNDISTVFRYTVNINYTPMIPSYMHVETQTSRLLTYVKISQLLEIGATKIN